MEGTRGMRRDMEGRRRSMTEIWNKGGYAGGEVDKCVYHFYMSGVPKDIYCYRVNVFFFFDRAEKFFGYVSDL